MQHWGITLKLLIELLLKSVAIMAQHSLETFREHTARVVKLFQYEKVCLLACDLKK